MRRRNWTREETIIAFNVYCKIPFKASNARHPLIIKYANLIGRSPSALNMKIGNFGRLDPELKKQGIVGLSNGSKLDEEIWNEFNCNWEHLAFESELLISTFLKQPIEKTANIDTTNLPKGKERKAMIKVRVNQSFFRSTILASYNQTCCITGLNVPDLLIASHIIPWSQNKDEQLNPQNGLCLNSLHDKAFDRGLLTVSTDYKIILSKHLKDLETNKVLQDFFYQFEHKKIILPEKFLPRKDFLEYHNHHIFKS